MSASVPICRVIVDGEPRCGAWNMAVDEVLLESAVNEDACRLRWYRWERPTLSLGYFQEGIPFGRPAEWAGLPVVRRLSGGGAILHDQELTYACVLSAAHPFARQPRELYTRVHQRVIEVLAEFGVIAAFRGISADDRQGEFLCFGRGDAFDVVIGTEKILGSAQRRRKGAILQHGSLMLRRSAHAPQFRGILDFATVPIRVDKLSQRLAEQVGRLLADEVTQDRLTSSELEAAQHLAGSRYASNRRQ